MTPAELRALADQATPGPWLAGRDGDVVFVCSDDGNYEVLPFNEGVTQPNEADTRLIAVLGPDAARLLADAMEHLSYAHGRTRRGKPRKGCNLNKVYGCTPCRLLARFSALGQDEA
jgi:hypothetical protein